MATPWSLESPRLVIHRFEPTEAHAAFLVALYNSPLFISGNGDTGINTVDKALASIKDGFIAKAFERMGHGSYIISLRDPSLTPIGTISLMRGDYTAPDIGFALLPEYTGKGYAKEAGERIIEYATADRDAGGLGYPGVFGFAAKDNANSRRVCERLGLEYRGVYPLSVFGGKPSAVYTSEGITDLAECGIVEERLE